MRNIISEIQFFVVVAVSLNAAMSLIGACLVCVWVCVAAKVDFPILRVSVQGNVSAEPMGCKMLRNYSLSFAPLPQDTIKSGQNDGTIWMRNYPIGRNRICAYVVEKF